MAEYYKPEHLENFKDIGQGNDDLARRFFEYYGAVFEKGALSKREKSLIALAVAHAVQCPYCIDAYSRECLTQGSDLDEMTEEVHVATAIRSGASLVHGIQMVEHVAKTSM
ncbi:MAG: 4-carboxymuconolactone decarboxylase [bacterium]|nr:4-carboxymuconolactone decarboxylase [bacterium]